MLRSSVCDLLQIEHPIVQAGMGPFGSGAELAAAVSNAGALGTIGAAGRPVEDLKDQLARIADLTDRPYAINLVFPQVNEWKIPMILESRPSAFSFALGDPGDIVNRAHDAGIKFIQQVHTVTQAHLAAERGVDVIIAQGTEAGGFTGSLSTFALLPQVVDAVSPIPVLAAGGIAEGRGIAAAMILGAKGVNMGTRFLASKEATISDDWKQAILAAQSEDAVKAEIWKDIFPPPGEGSFDVVPRALLTQFIEQWQQQREEARQESETLMSEVIAAVQQGRMFDKIPFTGQSAGMINEILPAAEIIRRLIAEAEEALTKAPSLLA